MAWILRMDKVFKAIKGYWMFTYLFGRYPVGHFLIK